MSERATRVTGVVALAFIVLILISAFAPGSPPAADASVDKIRTFMTDHRSAILLANFLGLFATIAGVWVFVYLRQMTRGDDLTNLAGTAALVGLVFTGVMALVGGAMFSAPLYVKGFAEGSGDDTIRLVYSMQTLAFAGTAAGLMFAMGGAFFAIRRSGALPAAAAWVAALAAVANVVAAFATLSAGASGIGFIGFIGFVLFMLVSGVCMVMGKVTQTAGAAGRVVPAV